MDTNESILALNLRLRSNNALVMAGIKTVRELIGLSRDDLLQIRNLGLSCIHDIREKLGIKGMKLRNDKNEIADLIEKLEAENATLRLALKTDVDHARLRLAMIKERLREAAPVVHKLFDDIKTDLDF